MSTGFAICASAYRILAVAFCDNTCKFIAKKAISDICSSSPLVDPCYDNESKPSIMHTIHLYFSRLTIDNPQWIFCVVVRSFASIASSYFVHFYSAFWFSTYLGCRESLAGSLERRKSGFPSFLLSTLVEQFTRPCSAFPFDQWIAKSHRFSESLQEHFVCMPIISKTLWWSTPCRLKTWRLSCLLLSDSCKSFWPDLLSRSLFYSSLEIS